MRTALLLRDDLHEAGVDAHFGIATGRVFIGGRGGASRLEFAIMGPNVVLAARLASVAEDILCDATTRGPSRKGIRFESLPRVTLKAKRISSMSGARERSRAMSETRAWSGGAPSARRSKPPNDAGA